MTWRCLIAESTTGVIVDELKPSEQPSWETEICQKGQWGVSLRIGDGPNAKDNVMAYMTSGRYVWIVGYNNLLLQGGLPATGGFTSSTRTLQVSGPGIGNLFENRTVRTANAAPATIANSSNNFGLNNLSKRRVLTDLIYESLRDTDSGASIPFDINDGAGETGTETRRYFGTDLTNFWRRFTEEADDANGVEFIIRPYYLTQTSVAWKFALGTPLLGDQNLAAAWELSAAYGDIDVDYNMSVPVPHRVWVKGAGDGSVTAFGYAANTAALQAAKIPYADYVDTSHTDISDVAKLNSYATATLAERSVATETWKATVRIDGKNNQGVQISPELGSWSEGDQPLFRVTRHQVIPDGSYRRRIVGMSQGGQPGTVALTIKPTPLT